ncbi:hypothetical protein P389DRAFT_174085 [Cystobasidium minutum MCA 4210]|uniref:uncharacterized protein n=1 Tax=Cystobasidium minutum MCA 4210 TaxID=1397322 RepID=UPI0034CE2494|eukprot:jgi/Rhomi1/174085/fgenesh1_kg.7_\
MLLAYEKDGTIATPAYSNLHPHSNEWLKAQVCHRSCPYRAGTASLKRPKTVREHFRKCVYLDDKHPLKVLSALQLGVLEREANGQLPNRRRAKVIRLATESANTLY